MVRSPLITATVKILFGISLTASYKPYIPTNPTKECLYRCTGFPPIDSALTLVRAVYTGCAKTLHQLKDFCQLIYAGKRASVELQPQLFGKVNVESNNCRYRGSLWVTERLMADKGCSIFHSCHKAV